VRRVVALAVIGAALVAGCSGREPIVSTELGVPAERLGRTGWFCPRGHDTVGLDGLFYPPAHPLRPVVRPRPDRCFATDEEARRAGFELAPPPEGGQVVDGVYLVPADPGLQVECRSAARRLRFSVACPGLVPNDPGSVYVWSPRDSDEFRLESGFQGPPGYEGVGGEPHAHVWILSGRSELIGDEVCSLSMSQGTVRVRSHDGRWIACGEGTEFNGGHIVLRWAEGGVTYEVSLHGVNATNRRLARAIAEGLELVSP
jgi:hypothetical protein